MIVNIILIIIGFALLVFGANGLVNGASDIAHRLKISDFVIGITIVAMGTSAPELVVNIIAAVKGSTDIALGNIVGSNNFNLFFILGFTAIIYPLTVDKQLLRIDIPFNALIPVALLIAISDRFLDGNANQIDRSESAMFLIFFIIYYWYAIIRSKNEQATHEEVHLHFSKFWMSISFVIAGLAALFFGGEIVVRNSVDIAQKLGISERIIGLTIVAAGTSLPELFTSVFAAKKGKTDIAIGNIIGSNFFNVFFILAISGLITPIPVPKGFLIDILMMALSFIMLFSFALMGKEREINRKEGIVFVGTYFTYLVYMIIFS